MSKEPLFEIGKKILENSETNLTDEELERLISYPEHDYLDLIRYANLIREQYIADNIITCSIINAKSGLCSQDCAFCSQSMYHRTNVPIYPLVSKERIIENALHLSAQGAQRYSIVTSGLRFSAKELDVVCEAVEEIKKVTDLTVCASLGVLDNGMAKKLKKCGIGFYHHNLETSRSFFDQICTTHDYNEDIETLHIAKFNGLEVCSGGIMGLGETWEQRAELASTLKKLDVDGIPLNFLNPISGTKLGNRSVMEAKEAIKCVALFRFINPRKNIIVCGGREAVFKNQQSLVFNAGANGIIIGNYLTTKGQEPQNDIEMIKALNKKQ